MPKMPSDLALRPGVLREHDPMPQRLVLWARTGHHNPDWQRVSSTIPVKIVEHDGLCLSPAALAHFRTVHVGMLARMFGRFFGDDGSGRYLLPNGSHAEPTGLPRSDVLIVWPTRDDLSVDEDALKTRWPACEGCLQLGERLFAVIGAALPAPPATVNHAIPAVVAPPPPPSRPPQAVVQPVRQASPPPAPPSQPAPPPPPPPAASPPVAQPAVHPEPVGGAFTFSASLGAFSDGPLSAPPPPPRPPVPPVPIPEPEETELEEEEEPEQPTTAQSAPPDPEAEVQQQLEAFQDQIDLLSDADDFPQALAVARQAIGVARRLGDNHPSFALALTTLAELSCATGNHAHVGQPLHHAGEVWRRAGGENHPEYRRTLHLLATARVQNGQGNDALYILEQCAKFDDRLVGPVRDSSSEDLRLLHLEDFRDSMDRLLSLVVKEFTTSLQVVGMAYDLVLRRKALASEVMALPAEWVLAARKPDAQPQLEHLRILRGQIAWKVLGGPGNETLESYEQVVGQWIAEKERQEAALIERFPEVVLRLPVHDPSRKAVAGAMEAKSALVEFVRWQRFDFSIRGLDDARWQEDRYLAFVMAAGEPDAVKVVDLGPAEEIDRLIAEFRDSITEGKVYADESTDPGAALRRLVFDPVADVLGEQEQLVIAPDGELARLPFEVLPLEGGRLLDVLPIRYVATGRDLLRPPVPAGNRPGPAVVMADPDYNLASPDSQEGTTAGGRQSFAMVGAQLFFTRLADSRPEGERIASLLGVPPFLGAAAREGKLKTVRSPAILHLATHGFVLADQDSEEEEEVDDDTDDEVMEPFAESPLLRAGLALAGANAIKGNFTPPPDAEDGLLTGEDVTGLDLLETQMVVLSACEAGTGPDRFGSGLLAFRRSFILAGARTVVTSLWRVPGPARLVLLERFYQNLLKRGMGRGESLREAQQYTRNLTLGQLRRSAVGELVRAYLQPLERQPDDFRPFRHPRYWGAFICQGETGPLPTS